MEAPIMRALLSLLCSIPLVACVAGTDDTATDTGEATKAATLKFTSSWAVTQTGTLAPGSKVTIKYDAARAQCTGDFMGKPGYSVIASWRLGSGAASTVSVAGLPPYGALDPTFTIPSAVYGEGAPGGDLEMWFENTSRWGCHAWDSNLGQNYHFAVKAPSSAPDWMGKSWVVMSRATCDNGRACPGDGKALGTGFLWDSWSEQRAAIRQMSFEVFEKGVTDWNDPDTWKKLDVRLYSRVGDAGAFTSRYVDLDSHVGNNARYAVDLRTMHPLAVATISKKSDCPKFPLKLTGAGSLIEADVQFYFRVNGIDLRPADGTVFHGAYQQYAQGYAVCLAP
jgi:hypothetical protein